MCQVMDQLSGQPASFEVEVSTDATRASTRLRGELDLTVAPRLEQLLDQLRRTGYRELTVDLSGLEFLSVAGLNVFLRADEAQRAAGGRLVLTHPTHMTRRILALTRLDATLTIHDGDHPGDGLPQA